MPLSVEAQQAFFPQQKSGGMESLLPSLLRMQLYNAARGKEVEVRASAARAKAGSAQDSKNIDRVISFLGDAKDSPAKYKARFETLRGQPEIVNMFGRGGLDYNVLADPEVSPEVLFKEAGQQGALTGAEAAGKVLGEEQVRETYKPIFQKMEEREMSKTLFESEQKQRTAAQISEETDVRKGEKEAEVDYNSRRVAIEAGLQQLDELGGDGTGLSPDDNLADNETSLGRLGPTYLANYFKSYLSFGDKEAKLEEVEAYDIYLEALTQKPSPERKADLDEAFNLLVDTPFEDWASIYKDYYKDKQRKEVRGFWKNLFSRDK